MGKKNGGGIYGALVFDGIYDELARVGLPIPLVPSLNLKNLTLDVAMWNVRCSATGFSVSLFWPSGGAGEETEETSFAEAMDTEEGQVS